MTILKDNHLKRYKRCDFCIMYKNKGKSHNPMKVYTYCRIKKKIEKKNHYDIIATKHYKYNYSRCECS